MHNEYDAANALGAYYDERARWLQVLTKPATFRPYVKKSFFARLLGL